MKKRAMGLVGILGGLAAAAAACGGSSGSDTSVQNDASKPPAPFPKLADYDRSCAVSEDCLLVPVEGCPQCTAAALNAKAAPSYKEKHSQATSDAMCPAPACAAGGNLKAICRASVCALE